MCKHPTPGEVAYTAFWSACAQAFGADVDPWPSISPATQRAWKAAAQAVLHAGHAPEPATGWGSSAGLDALQGGHAMSTQEHTYPSAYGRGQHWALDEAWAILDTLTPGAIPAETRFLLSGMITGTLMRLVRDGHLQPPDPPPEDTP